MSDNIETRFPTEDDLDKFAFWEGVYAEEARQDGERLRDRDLKASMTRWEEYKQTETKSLKTKDGDAS